MISPQVNAQILVSISIEAGEDEGDDTEQVGYDPKLVDEVIVVHPIHHD